MVSRLEGFPLSGLLRCPHLNNKDRDTLKGHLNNKDRGTLKEGHLNNNDKETLKEGHLNNKDSDLTP